MNSYNKVTVYVLYRLRDEKFLHMGRICELEGIRKESTHTYFVQPSITYPNEFMLTAK